MPRPTQPLALFASSPHRSDASAFRGEPDPQLPRIGPPLTDPKRLLVDVRSVVRGTETMEYWTEFDRSFWLDASIFDDGPPLLNLGSLVCAESLGRLLLGRRQLLA
jgi:hypothetical protein